LHVVAAAPVYALAVHARLERRNRHARRPHRIKVRAQHHRRTVPIAPLRDGVRPPRPSLLHPTTKPLLRQPGTRERRNGRFAMRLLWRQSGIHRGNANQLLEQIENSDARKRIRWHETIIRRHTPVTEGGSPSVWTTTPDEVFCGAAPWAAAGPLAG